MPTPKEQSLKSVGRTPYDHYSWIPLTATCSSDHLLQKTTTMADKSPAKFPVIDDPEAMEMRLALQVLSYSCTDNAVTRQEHKRQCTETGDRAMKLIVRNTRKNKALTRETIMLRQVKTKLENDNAKLRRENAQLKDAIQQSRAIPDDITDEDMMAITDPADPAIPPLVLSSDEQDTTEDTNQKNHSP
ncbi:hypothetical protein ABVT39_001733 [Epinephelus coioides]